MECLDVLVIGAGLSGIGAACHLSRELPDSTYLVLEAREAIGGTWDLFRYPGVRSDSDMFTLGYAFRPWVGDRSLVDGAAILAYLQATAREYAVTDRIRLGHRVRSAAWSCARARWTVEVEQVTTGDVVRIDCRFLFANTGYYRYDRGHLPSIPGLQDFAGPVVHPHEWPAELDWAGRRVIVVGSGSTAVTLVPELARSARHVTMLQRTATYVAAVPARDPLVRALRGRLPAAVVRRLARTRNVLRLEATYRASRRWPGLVRAALRADARRRLPRGYDVRRAFEPAYDPWDQRLCAAPDGDLFTAITEQRAEVVTGTVLTVLPHGIRLTDGRLVEADILVTATGIELLALGGITLSVDDVAIDPADCLTYRGMMLSGVPNLAFTMGYTTASWTLRSDLVARHVCQLLRHMARHGHRTLTPTLPAEASTWERAPLIGFTSGFALRGRARMPHQGPAAPWTITQSYLREVGRFRWGRLTHPALRYH